MKNCHWQVKNNNLKKTFSFPRNILLLIKTFIFTRKKKYLRIMCVFVPSEWVKELKPNTSIRYEINIQTSITRHKSTTTYLKMIQLSW